MSETNRLVTMRTMGSLPIILIFSYCVLLFGAVGAIGSDGAKTVSATMTPVFLGCLGVMVHKVLKANHDRISELESIAGINLLDARSSGSGVGERVVEQNSGGDVDTTHAPQS